MNSLPDSVIKLLCDGASGDRELEVEVFKTWLEVFELWKTRHRKYGRGNIAEYADAGCLVRDSDKSARLRRYYFDDKSEDFDDETVIDSWRDKVNYAIMGLMCYLGRWPGVLSNERTYEAS